jgi:pyruvate dehydrogenase E1 component alpha subunit
LEKNLLAEDKSKIVGVSKKAAIELYRTMLGIRQAQEALMEEYHPADAMRCPVHFCVGQEGPPAGVCQNLSRDDYIFTGHRSHGYYLAKGGSLKGLFAELYGKATGSNAGKAGSMEICDEEVNFFSGTILVGTLPIAAGAALASQMRGEDRVTVAVFGDGGADEGLVYETLNFAALKRLPMVFICENNLYSTYSRQSARQAICDLASRGRAFGVPSRRLLGNDVLAVFRAMRRAVFQARRSFGPSLLELETYRWCPHVGPEDDDHFLYRPPEELAMWRRRCPIEMLKSTLIKEGILTESDIKATAQGVKDQIQAAFDYAKASPFPPSTAITQDVFSDQPDTCPIPFKESSDSPFDFQQAEVVPRPY